MLLGMTKICWIGMICLLMKVCSIDLDPKAEVKNNTALIKVLNGGVCCCNMTLGEWSFFYYKTIRENCGGDEACNNCRSFTINNLAYNTDYRVTYTFPNSTDKSVLFKTDFLRDVNLNVDVFGVDAVITANSEFNLTLGSCQFQLYSGNTLVTSCSFSCESCATYTALMLKPNTNYTIKYKSAYMADYVTANFTTKTVSFNISIEPSYNSLEVSFDNAEGKLTDCLVEITAFKSELLNFSCTATPECTTCGAFNITNLLAGSQYRIKASLNKTGGSRVINIDTRYIIISQRAHRMSINEIFVVVTTSKPVKVPLVCNVETDNPLVICKKPCPTDCGNYTLTLSSFHSGTINSIITSPLAKGPVKLEITPTPLRISLVSAYFTQNKFFVLFNVNMKGAGRCDISATINQTLIDLKCDGPCPTDCDNLNYTFTNLPANTNVTFTIRNPYLKVSYERIIKTESLIVISKTLNTTFDTAIVEIDNVDSACCCNVRVTRGIFISQQSDCGKNKDCASCKTFNITNLIPNESYNMHYTLPNNTEATRSFRTQYLEVAIDYVRTSSSIDIEVRTPYKGISKSGCTFELLKAKKTVQKCDFNCTSCYNHSFVNLESGTTYLFKYKNTYMKTSNDVNISTLDVPHEFNFEITPQFTTASVKVTHSPVSTPYCAIKLVQKGGATFPFDCNKTAGCSECKDFKITGLKVGALYVMTMTFVNHDNATKEFQMESLDITTTATQPRIDEILINVVTKTGATEKYSCSVEISRQDVTCVGSCPTNCGSFKLRIPRLDRFNVTINSSFLVSPVVILVVSARYSFTFRTGKYTGEYLPVRANPNVLGGGICITTADGEGTPFQLLCKVMPCPTDCDKLEFNITNVVNYRSFSLTIANMFLFSPQTEVISVGHKITVKQAVNITANSASFEVLNGNECCCEVKVYETVEETNPVADCNNNQDCKMCRSFTIRGLRSDRDYYLYHTDPGNFKVVRHFKTLSSKSDIVVISSFTSISIKVSYGSTSLPSKCSFIIFDANGIVSSCENTCPSCTFHEFTGLQTNTAYTVEYTSDISEPKKISVTTLVAKFPLPSIEAVGQSNSITAQISIKADTDYDFTGSYRAFPRNNRMGISDAYLSGTFKKSDKFISLMLPDKDAVYDVEVCFEIIDSICSSKPDDISCNVCSNNTVKMCSSKSIVSLSTGLTCKLDADSLSYTYNRNSLYCHSISVCSFGVRYILRKAAVDSDEVEIIDSKLLSTDSSNIKVISTLNSVECLARTDLIIKSTQEKDIINNFNLKNIYYSAIFAVCNEAKCFVSTSSNKIYISGSNSSVLAVLIIFLLLAAAALAFSAVMIFKTKHKTYGIQDGEISRRDTLTVEVDPNYVPGNNNAIKFQTQEAKKEVTAMKPNLLIDFEMD